VPKVHGVFTQVKSFAYHRGTSAMLLCVHDSSTNRIMQQWTGSFFKRTPLASLGLRVQLGHRRNEMCRDRQPGHQDLVVIHTNGIHEVAVDYCVCQEVAKVGDFWQQLMRQQWYPGSTTKPRTVCTFGMLKHFHALTLEGKMSLHGFYGRVEKRTDNTGTVSLKVCRRIHCGKYLCANDSIIVSISCIFQNYKTVATPQDSAARRNCKQAQS